MESEPRENAAGLAAVVHSRAKQWIDMSHYTTIDAANNLERPLPPPTLTSRRPPLRGELNLGEAGTLGEIVAG